jgi:hypothetical protein
MLESAPEVTQCAQSRTATSARYGSIVVTYGIWIDNRRRVADRAREFVRHERSEKGGKIGKPQATVLLVDLFQSRMMKFRAIECLVYGGKVPPC